MNRKTKGTIVALISATALASAFAASASGTETQATTNGYGKRGLFQRKELTEAEKTEMQKRMATDLSSVLGTNQAAILSDLQAGKSVRDIVTASGKDEKTIIAALKEKRDAEMKIKLAEEVASGKITQAQADKILSHKVHGEGRGNNENILKDLASILGIDSASIKAKLDTGKTVKEVVTEAGFNDDDVRTKMDTLRDANMKARLAEGVTSGKLTQAQADEKYAEMKKRVTERKALRDSGTQINAQ